MTMDPRWILVTGCSSGFGKLVANTLLARGHRVIATARDPEGRDAAGMSELKKAGALVVALDVGRDDSVDSAFARIREHTTRLDVVINNAGISSVGLTEGFTAEQVLALFQVNALGAIRVNRAALPLMKPFRAGLLIHLSTGLARLPMPCFGPYAASKAALEAIAETYRYELAPIGIESVIVEPGPYPTNLGAHALSPANPERLADYGSLVDLPENMFRGLAALFEGPNAPKAQDVPDAIVDVIETPPGRRPLRRVVGGTGAMLVELNALTDQLQSQIFRAQGLEALLTTSIASGTSSG